jgi:hypothetical protein
MEVKHPIPGAPEYDLLVEVLARHAAEMKGVAKVVAALARATPGRTSIRQGLGLLVLSGAFCDEELTLADLQKVAGEDADGNPIINKSVMQSFGHFIDDGWVEQGISKHDRRQRVLKLTPKGEKIMAEIVAELVGE